MTHRELVDRAVRWLIGTAGCAVVLRECGAQSGNEVPDAIGWTPRGGSVLVECKTSVSDLYADRHKPSQRGGSRCGARRYLMTDCDAITVHRTLPGWGLLRVGNRIKRERESELFEQSREAELMLLVAELRRCRGRAPNGLVDPSTDGESEQPKDPRLVTDLGKDAHPMIDPKLPVIRCEADIDTVFGPCLDPEMRSGMVNLIKLARGHFFTVQSKDPPVLVFNQMVRGVERRFR